MATVFQQRSVKFPTEPVKQTLLKKYQAVLLKAKETFATDVYQADDTEYGPGTFQYDKSEAKKIYQDDISSTFENNLVKAVAHNGILSLDYLAKYANQVRRIEIDPDKHYEFKDKLNKTSFKGPLLCLATQRKSVAVAVFLLLVHCTDLKINATDSEGRTALHHAALNGNYELCELYLQSGADINARDRLGKTALMYAAETGVLDLCQLLVMYNAKVNLVSKECQTALTCALLSKNINPRTVSELLQLGAQLVLTHRKSGEKEEKKSDTSLVSSDRTLNPFDELCSNTSTNTKSKQACALLILEVMAVKKGELDWLIPAAINKLGTNLPAWLKPYFDFYAKFQKEDRAELDKLWLNEKKEQYKSESHADSKEFLSVVNSMLHIIKNYRTLSLRHIRSADSIKQAEDLWHSLRSIDNFLLLSHTFASLEDGTIPTTRFPRHVFYLRSKLKEFLTDDMIRQRKLLLSTDAQPDKEGQLSFSRT